MIKSIYFIELLFCCESAGLWNKVVITVPGPTVTADEPVAIITVVYQL